MCIALTSDDKEALYQNCTIFDKSDIYGGPVCGDNGVTYANSFYLDCKNHHNHETGKLIFLFQLTKIDYAQICIVILELQ